MKYNDYPKTSNEIITKALHLISSEVKKNNPLIDGQVLRQKMLTTIDMLAHTNPCCF